MSVITMEAGPENCCEAYQHTATTLHSFPYLGTVHHDAQHQVPNLHFAMSVFWPNNHHIRVGFRTGSEWQRHEVKTHAEEWTRYANINFHFVEQAPFDVLVDFQPGSSWSVIGTLSKMRALMRQPTMNIGQLTTQLEHRERKALVLHQFGHVLGLIHDHHNGVSHPHENIAWTRQAVHEYFQQPPNQWDAHRSNLNVLANCSGGLLQKETFDLDSIMLHSFPRDLFVNGHGTTQGFDLSKMDKAAMLERYPGRDKGELASQIRLIHHDGQVIVGMQPETRTEAH